MAAPKKGDRVRLSLLGIQRLAYHGGHRRATDQGTVMRVMYNGNLQVLIDGNSRPSEYHPDYWETGDGGEP